MHFFFRPALTLAVGMLMVSKTIAQQVTCNPNYGDTKECVCDANGGCDMTACIYSCICDAGNCQFSADCQSADAKCTCKSGGCTYAGSSSAADTPAASPATSTEPASEPATTGTDTMNCNPNYDGTKECTCDVGGNCDMTACISRCTCDGGGCLMSAACKEASAECICGAGGEQCTYAEESCDGGNCSSSAARSVYGIVFTTIISLNVVW